ncbi:MAG: acetyl-CoA hydrolase/transferase C-terminal domain-containing protein [Actinomycetota bacterium]|nr:acetyl-CoA hydrolase/transferase C-terminal domain-containing protein [Actinomycetota bacterium]MDG1488796.1 acetyl-CoA hydrolase/transferase C-terminal domain-containing protein [Actinomycetota bacterium]MDG2121288.1 acetyl-CoA hydrolase/transferase C-terminal domain-containing protein [Actinomycetota bacterium]
MSKIFDGNDVFDWTKAFAEQVLTPGQAAATVENGDSLACSLPEPTGFLYALAKRTELRDITIFIPAPRRGGVAIAKHPGVELRTPFLTQIMRDAGAHAEVVPVRLEDWGTFTKRNASRISIVQVGKPRPDGSVAPGSAIAGNDALVRKNRQKNDLVFALVNPVVPDVPGDSFHVSDFDGLIEIPLEGSIPVFDERIPPKDLDPYIQALDELIPDGATVQSGVGGLTEIALSRLTHKQNLGIHTEVMCQGLLDLMRSGAANNRLKTVFPNKTVFTIALPETFSFIDQNPDCHIVPASIALNHQTIGKNRDMRCVNGALEIDLWGQVNSEMINGTQHSGVGGALDFLRGCQLSEDAVSIHLLPATAAKGTKSRIVNQIKTNAVTATRYDVDVVVTEFGIARLKDASVRQKATRLIQIAHPTHQAELTEQAQRMGII